MGVLSYTGFSFSCLCNCVVCYPAVSVKVFSADNVTLLFIVDHSAAFRTSTQGFEMPFHELESPPGSS